MRSLQKTYYLCNILFIVLFLAVTGCAGRKPSPQAPEKPGPERPYAYKPGVLPRVPGMVEPILRIGLKTDAKSSTLESEKGLYVSDGSRTFSGGSRVVASPAYMANVVTGYTVQVDSFSSRENAEQARAALSGRTSRRVFVYHNADRDLEQVRVGPFSTKEEAQKVVEEMKALGHTGAFYVSDGAGSGGTRAELVIRDDAGSIVVKTQRPVQIWTSDLTLLIDRDPYRGYVTVFVNDQGRVTVVNAVNFEDYLKGVVPNEIGGGSADTFDALKAQAVAARTYAYKNRGQFEKDGFDICASARCQVYSGMKNEANLTSSAVVETKGEVLTYAGDPINALYTSTCGGRTENAENMFENMNFPYLKSVECYPEEGATKQASAKLEGSVQPWWLAWMNAKMGSAVGGDMSQPLQTAEAASAISELLQFLGKTSCSTQSLQGTSWIATGNQLVS
ncbi:MAG TPA: SpoIID/LytB domain-containing protein, partial [Acidobacteriota bacterium]|nr:SpoIID/LytB domain-containing protein [Acidobacteriota bacterium]